MFPQPSFPTTATSHCIAALARIRTMFAELTASSQTWQTAHDTLAAAHRSFAILHPCIPARPKLCVRFASPDMWPSILLHFSLHAHQCSFSSSVFVFGSLLGIMMLTVSVICR